MSNYNSTLQSNNTDLQAILDSINALPDAGGVDLPELTNEGTASDLILGKELIDDEGNIVTGTFSIDSELNAQNDLISQIQAAVDGLPEASTPNVNTIYIASTEPTNDIGVDGDFYIVRSNSV